MTFTTNRHTVLIIVRFGSMLKEHIEYEVRIPITEEIVLDGDLFIPKASRQFVLFIHGSGSSRFSPRNTYVAQQLQKSGIGTLLIDLLTPWEDEVYATRFDIQLLTNRVMIITTWLQKEFSGRKYALGYFGASTGAAAALRAAVQFGHEVSAIVSRGGRPDLAEHALEEVTSPTLFIVGGEDREVIALNKIALKKMHTTKKLEIVPGATHLFEEEGALENVTKLATDWFLMYLQKQTNHIAHRL